MDRRFASLVASAVALSFTAHPLLAGDGDLDEGWNGTGLRTFNFNAGPPSEDLGKAIVAQPDGKLVVAGSVSFTPDDSDFGFVRFRRDGTLDPDFGGGGKQRVAIDEGSFPNLSDQVLDLALQPDGKIVACGRTETTTANQYRLVVARLTAEGDLDTTFATNLDDGFEVFNPGGGNDNVTGCDLVVREGGEIAVVWSSLTSNKNGVLALSSAGVPFPGFGVAGFAEFPCDDFGDSCSIDRIVDLPGGLLVAGTYLHGVSSELDLLIATVSTTGSFTAHAVENPVDDSESLDVNGLALQSNFGILLGATLFHPDLP